MFCKNENITVFYHEKNYFLRKKLNLNIKFYKKLLTSGFVCVLIGMLSLNKKEKIYKNKIGGSLCFRHISLKKDREKKNTASEKE